MYYLLPTVMGHERCISGSIYNKRIVSVYKSSSVQQSFIEFGYVVFGPIDLHI
jgi:hypothetical protein